ncbi:MAG: FliH/SctL family protein [Lachnospiraceae bacterium]
MYSNLYKRGVTVVSKEDTRIIDSNALMAKKLAKNNTGRLTPMPADEDGFSKGLSAEVLDVLTSDVGEQISDGEMQKDAAPESMEPSVEELRQQALLEIEEMKEEAAASLAIERNHVLEAAKNQGYEEGRAQGIREADGLKNKLEAERKSLERQYEEQLDKLEPQFIDTLTGIYEHIFNVELSGYRDIIVYLISTTMRSIEGGRDFIVHVSKEDYSYVSMQKKQLEEGIPTGSTTLEIVEDITLSKNQALIETDGGIFDCGLGTELTELHKKLKLLSYEKPVEE